MRIINGCFKTDLYEKNTLKRHIISHITQKLFIHIMFYSFLRLQTMLGCEVQTP